MDAKKFLEMAQITPEKVTQLDIVEIKMRLDRIEEWIEKVIAIADEVQGSSDV